MVQLEAAHRRDLVDVGAHRPGVARRSASAATARTRSGSTRSSRRVTTPGRISLPPPPAPQWFDCAWPIVILTSRLATSCAATPGVPRDETPTNVYISALRGSFWRNAMPMRSMRARFSRPTFCSCRIPTSGRPCRSRRSRTASVTPAASSSSSTAGRILEAGVGPELVVDHDRDALRAGDQVGEARARTAGSAAPRAPPPSCRPRAPARPGRSRRAGCATGCRARASRGRPASRRRPRRWSADRSTRTGSPRGTCRTRSLLASGGGLRRLARGNRVRQAPDRVWCQPSAGGGAWHHPPSARRARRLRPGRARGRARWSGMWSSGTGARAS